VLAVALPAADLALIESVGRKAHFLGRAVEALGLTNVRAVNARAEAWPEGHGRFDAVTARALAPLGVVLEYAAPLLRPGGIAVAWKGARDPAAEADAAVAADELGLELDGILVPEGLRHARDRHLYVYVKVRATPARYPRRPGMARKRPIGRSTRA
jgi:16S rRNA (guanine527-N7)-methyltransferase